MIFRTALQELKKWSQQPSRKPLILRGARQVGKTTLINLFAEHYQHYIELNLDLKSDRALFEQTDEVEDFVSAVFLKHELPKTAIPHTLLFIDEIQSSPEAVQMMRYFYEKLPALSVVAAGSLLETVIDTQVSFPVGRVTYLFLYPLTFTEYLLAGKHTEAVKVLEQKPVPDFAHTELSKHFYQYALIGGMPEVVNHYSEHRDLVALNKLYQDLLVTYQDDVEKYAKLPSMRGVIRHCISRSPFEASRRIKFQGFGSSNYGSKEIKAALGLLEKAMLVKLIYPTSEVHPPILPNFNRSPKLQFLDTGLLNHVVGLQNEFVSMQGLNDIYQGRIAEHIVGQTLLAADLLPNSDLNFWVREKKQSSAEVDFIVPYQDKLIPVEVKSGTAGKLKSLHQFIDRAPHDIAVRIYAGPFSIETHKTIAGKSYRLVNLPFYLAHQIRDYLALA